MRSSSIRMMLRVLSRVTPNRPSSSAAGGVCDAPNRKYPFGSRVAMNFTDRSQNAHVPSKRMMPLTPIILPCREALDQRGLLGIVRRPVVAEDLVEPHRRLAIDVRPPPRIPRQVRLRLALHQSP